MKNILDLSPVYHRLEDRIRAHVLLCWLAMVLIRYAENESGCQGRFEFSGFSRFQLSGF